MDKYIPAVYYDAIGSEGSIECVKQLSENLRMGCERDGAMDGDWNSECYREDRAVFSEYFEEKNYDELLIVAEVKWKGETVLFLVIEYQRAKTREEGWEQLKYTIDKRHIRCTINEEIKKTRAT